MAKGKSANPADAHRKALRKKELNKNKTDRKKAREVAVVKKDTRCEPVRVGAGRRRELTFAGGLQLSRVTFGHSLPRAASLRRSRLSLQTFALSSLESPRRRQSVSRVLLRGERCRPCSTSRRRGPP